MLEKGLDEKSYPHSQLTDQILKAAFRVHTALGPGYLEKIYENALTYELEQLDLRPKQQVRFNVLYQGKLIGQHVLDIIVENKVYVELKAQKITELETAQVLSGLKASRLQVGLLINFNTPHLRNGIRRVILPAGYLDNSTNP